MKSSRIKKNVWSQKSTSGFSTNTHGIVDHLFGRPSTATILEHSVESSPAETLGYEAKVVFQRPGLGGRSTLTGAPMLIVVKVCGKSLARQICMCADAEDILEIDTDKNVKKFCILKFNLSCVKQIQYKIIVFIHI